MKIAVFGASGKVGRLVVDHLIESGHTVTAFIHKSNPFENKSGINTVTGSISDSGVVGKAIDGNDAVISTLGSWGSLNKDIVSTGTRSIVEAMTELGVKRLVTVTGASAFYSLDKPDSLAKLTRKTLSLIAPKILRDGEHHLAFLENSSLDWTSVRSPAMTSANSESYRLSDRLPSILAFVPRQAVAKCLVDQITDTKHIKQAPVIYRG